MSNTSSIANLPQGVVSIFAYLFPLLGAILLIVLETQSYYVYFHAWQALFCFVLIFIPFYIIFIIISIAVIGLGFFNGLWWACWYVFMIIMIVFCFIRGESGVPLKIPLIGTKLADNFALKKFPGAATAQPTGQTQPPPEQQPPAQP